MSFISQLETLLAAPGAELSAGEQVLAGWITRLVHHYKVGDVIQPAPQAGTGDGATMPGTGNAPTPVVTTAPSYPTVDADGCIKPEAFVGTPLASYRCMIQDTYEQLGVPVAVKANLLSNFDENFGIRVLDNNSDPFSISGITEGHNYMVPRMQPSNNPPPYGDVLVFPAKNTANGWPGFTLADCAAFVARCQETGKWPKIDHTGVGAVA